MRLLRHLGLLIAVTAGVAAVSRPTLAGPAAGCEAVAGNLIQDCGFEADTNYLTSFDGAIYAELGSPWIVSDASDNTVAAPGNNAGVLAPFSPHSGKNFLAMGARNGAFGTATQSFADQPGDHLKISFWLGSDGVLPNEFSLTYDGTVLTDLTEIGKQPYTLLSFVVQATGLDTLVLGGSSDNPTGFLSVDDIIVVSAPEPDSWTLALFGLAALAVVRRPAVIRKAFSSRR